MKNKMKAAALALMILAGGIAGTAVLAPAANAGAGVPSPVPPRCDKTLNPNALPLWMCAVGNGRRDADDGDRSDPSG